MYSQYDEEQYILEAFGMSGWTENGASVPIKEDRSIVRFLDIGAWNAIDKSNTRRLFELGWSGVLIEPSPGPMLGLLKEYGNEPRVTLIQAAVVKQPGLVKLHVTDDAVTTSSDQEYEKWRETAKYHGSMLAPGITLSEIATRFGGFEFVSIDAEGSSVDLFLEMLKLGWQPTCICVEHDGREGEIIAAATPQHYHLVYGNGTNHVWVRK